MFNIREYLKNFSEEDFIKRTSRYYLDQALYKQHQQRTDALSKMLKKGIVDALQIDEKHLEPDQKKKKKKSKNKPKSNAEYERISELLSQVVETNREILRLLTISNSSPTGI